MSNSVTISRTEYNRLIDASRRAREYFNILCKFKNQTDVLAANFDEALMNATPDPRTQNATKTG